MKHLDNSEVTDMLTKKGASEWGLGHCRHDMPGQNVSL